MKSARHDDVKLDCWPCVKPEESTINNVVVIIKEQVVRKQASADGDLHRDQYDD